MAAAHARSAPTAWVDKSVSEIALQDQRMAKYEARLRLEGSVLLVPNAMAGPSIPHGAGHSQAVHTGAYSTCNPLQVGESVRFSL